MTPPGDRVFWVVAHQPFWGPVLALVGASLAVAFGAVFGPDALVDAGLLSRDQALAPTLGLLFGGMALVIGGFVGLSWRARGPEGPRIPGTRVIAVRVTEAGFTHAPDEPWETVAGVEHVEARAGGNAASAMPVSVGGVPVRPAAGAVVVARTDGEPLVLAPETAEGGRALHAALRDGLKAFRDQGAG